MKDSDKLTEQSSGFQGLEYLPTKDILTYINQEDEKVSYAVKQVIPLLTEAVEQSLARINLGGRVFYIGAGTSGRLAITDASEIPPTFGVSDLFIALIAGGDGALRKAVEFAEDDIDQAWKDLLKYNPTQSDILVGLSASGTTPYVLGGLQAARNQGLVTIGITCNPGAPIQDHCDYCLEALTGPEFIRGSTRMKAGTAQKLILNMYSTALMVRLGKVQGDKMVDMQLSNKKLLNRGAVMIMEETGLSFDESKDLLSQYGNVRKAIDSVKK
jgi:N-acetylmuramic acid 6-phosphate etherase